MNTSVFEPINFTTRKAILHILLSLTITTLGIFLLIFCHKSSNGERLGINIVEFKDNYFLLKINGISCK